MDDEKKQMIKKYIINNNFTVFDGLPIYVKTITIDKIVDLKIMKNSRLFILIIKLLLLKTIG